MFFFDNDGIQLLARRSSSKIVNLHNDLSRLFIHTKIKKSRWVNESYVKYMDRLSVISSIHFWSIEFDDVLWV
jgi:hypothetical protein